MYICRDYIYIYICNLYSKGTLTGDLQSGSVTISYLCFLPLFSVGMEDVRKPIISFFVFIS